MSAAGAAAPRIDGLCYMARNLNAYCDYKMAQLQGSERKAERERGQVLGQIKRDTV